MIRNDALPNKFTLYLRRLYYYFTNERFSKKFNYDWNKTQTRFEIINKIILKKGFKSYLEIGCQSDVNFSKIIIDNKIGVDPQSGGTHRMTSDKFFLENKSTFDLIFIDGGHDYNTAESDLLNCKNLSHKNTIVIMDDTVYKKEMICEWNIGPTNVWKKAVEKKIIKEISKIEFDRGRGMSWGRYS